MSAFARRAAPSARAARGVMARGVLTRRVLTIVLALPGLCGLSGGARAADAVAIAPIGDAEARAIAERVFRNETGGDVERLLWWNPGEAFPSLGIGHFIWYPAGVDERFEESFPALVRFARAHAAPPPAWLAGPPVPACPWPDRDAFMAAAGEPRRTGLARWLRETTDVQARFLLARAEARVPSIVAAARPADRARVAARIDALSATPGGRFALVDYVNFKGSGLAPRERYRGVGWGLAQVLEEMRGEPCASVDFADAAVRVLERRVRNAPPARGEARWLAGWRARARAYAAPGECGQDG